MPNCARVIALIDMDCFYVQVEERDDPSIKGIPAAVVQYNAYKGGGLIAVNYEARAKGVNRHMRGDDAKAACPEILLVKVPELRGKADLTKYRSAGSEVIKILSEFPTVVERASVDEAYVDLTQMVEARLSATGNEWDIGSVLENINTEYLDNNFVQGFDSTQSWLSSLRNDEMMSIADAKLAIGAEIVGQMRRAVYEKSGFRCSAGIAHNKVLAKLVCGLNKPNKQTVLPFGSVSRLYDTTKVKQIRNLGGKLGDLLNENFNCETMGELALLSEKDLCTALGTKTGSWLYHLARGDDDEVVRPRQLPKSIGCNKNFPGREALRNIDKIKHWITQLSAEVVERLQRDFDANNRKSKTLTLHIRFEDGNQISKACGIPSYDPQRMASDVNQVIEKIHSKTTLSITSLGIIASKFEEELDSSTFVKIDSFFSKQNTRTKPCTITRPSDLDPEISPGITTPQRQCQASDSAQSTSVSTPVSAISLSPKPSTSRVCFLPVSEEPVIGSPFTGPILSTKDFFERVSQAEVLVSASLQKIRKHNANLLGDKKNSVQGETISVSPKIDSGVQDNQLPSTSTTVASDPNSFERPTAKSSIKSLSRKCERCGNMILIWDLPVHMDYHFAKDVQREINGLPPLPVGGKDKKTEFKPVPLPKRIKPIASKRKNDKSNGKGGKKSRGETFGMRSIQSYFSPITQASTNQDG